MQPIFHRQRIQAMGMQMAAAGQQLLESWDRQPAGAVVNLSREMKLVTLDIINRTMFSVNVLPEVDKIGASVDVGLHYINRQLRSLVRLPSDWPTPANRRFKRSQATLNEYLYRVISERRASGEHSGDLLDMLLAARDEDTGLGMDDEQVRNEVASIYGAGHETTAVALTWTWYALNQHPAVLRRLQQEVDTVLAGRPPTVADLPNLPYTLMVLEESMRLFPPVPISARTATIGTELGGFALPQGRGGADRHQQPAPAPGLLGSARGLPPGTLCAREAGRHQPTGVHALSERSAPVHRQQFRPHGRSTAAGDDGAALRIGIDARRDRRARRRGHHATEKGGLPVRLVRR